jgi:hypothetical protein
MSVADFVATFESGATKGIKNSGNSSQVPLYLHSDPNAQADSRNVFSMFNPNSVSVLDGIDEYIVELLNASDGLLKRNRAIPSFHFGGAQSGAPTHFHGLVLNFQVHGMKRWAMDPPRSSGRSKLPAKIFFETVIFQNSSAEANDTTGGQKSELEKFAAAERVELVVYSGDILVVPNGWGHATFNAEAGFAAGFELLYLPGQLQEDFSHNGNHFLAACPDGVKRCHNRMGYPMLNKSLNQTIPKAYGEWLRQQDVGVQLQKTQLYQQNQQQQQQQQQQEGEKFDGVNKYKLPCEPPTRYCCLSTLCGCYCTL